MACSFSVLSAATDFMFSVWLILPPEQTLIGDLIVIPRWGLKNLSPRIASDLLSRVFANEKVYDTERTGVI